MPTAPTYPGVYIEEVPSGVRTIAGVGTSITAFVGVAQRGPANEPVRLQSFADFERTFGGLWGRSTMSYALQHYFLNGGRDAVVVRVVHLGGEGDENDARATLTLGEPDDGLGLEAASEGAWGNRLRIRVDHDTRPPDTSVPGESADTLFNLTVKDAGTGAVESFRNVSMAQEHPRHVARVLARDSTLVRVAGAVPAHRPAANHALALGAEPFTDAGTGTPDAVGDPTAAAFRDDGRDGTGHDEDDLVPTDADGTGIHALERTGFFNLLCVPPIARDGVLTPAKRALASALCGDRRALLLADPDPGWDDAAAVVAGLDDFSAGVARASTALYFPRVRAADPLLDGALEDFPPSGAVAGVIARTDAARGVWKAPAGQDAALLGVAGLSVPLTDGQTGILNPLGVNCLRSFPIAGQVVWGARTLAGADALASEWRYVPVRRLALFLEESLYRGTRWAVFEPNDEPLWSQLRLNVGAFMHDLFRQGAFAGASPRDAYLVKCDADTTTPSDVQRGIVNVLVGFAPLEPAEFVVIRLAQMAGQPAA